MTDRLHLAVALTDTGWHPASWREAGARPQDVFTAGYWVDLVREAERGLVDFVTIEDGLRLQSDHPWSARRPDRPGARPARRRRWSPPGSARRPPSIGLVPTAVVNHTEPFHTSKAIATLDYVTSGRGGVRVQLDGGAATAAHFGRRDASFGAADLRDLDNPEVQARIAEAFDEAADYVEVLRRLWDSWEDDAEIRDVATGRFVDRAKLHHIDFEGRSFSVKGPSITPRPPQGQPLVTSLGHAEIPYRLIARSTDVGFVTPRDAEHAASDRRRRSARSRRPPAAPTRRCTSSATSWSSSTTTRESRRGAPATARRRRAVRERRPRLRRHPGRARGPPPGVGRRRADRLPAPAGGAAARPPADRRRAGARAAAPRRVPHVVRRRDAARPARPRPSGQPLRDRLRGDHDHDDHRAPQAGPPRRPLPGRQQHHGVERPGRRAATSSSSPSSTSRRPPSAASSTSCSSPRGCGCASRAARSTTSTSSAGRTPSRSSPRWPR